MKYYVEITEVLQKRIIVDASSKEEAYKIVKGKYDDEKIILGADDHIDTKIEVQN